MSKQNPIVCSIVTAVLFASSFAVSYETAFLSSIRSIQTRNSNHAVRTLRFNELDAITSSKRCQTSVCVSRPTNTAPRGTILRDHWRLYQQRDSYPSDIESSGDGARTTRADGGSNRFLGAGIPRPENELPPSEIPSLLMNALQQNNIPDADSGLLSMWEFSGDETRYIFKNNITDFIESAHETADQFPTSFYGSAMQGVEWSLETRLNRVGGESGWIATQVIRTISSDGRLRRWQWELRKKRRPPCMGCWFVDSIGSSDRDGTFDADG